MTIRTPRGQRGITLIEIVLWCAIVAAAAVAVFVFSKKASVTAAVETEQRQIENIVKTVDGLFATQSDFAALGTNGAVYLRDRAGRAGLKYSTNAAGEPTLMTGLGGGTGTLTLSVQSLTMPSGPSQPNNSYRLAYNGLTSNECSRLVTASYPVATRVRVSHDADDATGVQMSARGQLTVSPDEIASNCAGSERPSVFLYFVPARAIAAAPTPTAPPAARCNPIHETQQASCPAGQIGAITQERDGTCTGPGNTLVYTVWTTTDNTCQDPPVAPPTVTPPTTPDDCANNTYTQVLACPVGQVGQVVQQRTHDTCAGTMTAWTTLSSSCQPPPPTATCTPGTDTQIIACPAGQGGQINQTRSSTCSSPTAAPTWGGWLTTSNTCTAACSGGGTSCCTVQRQTQPGPVCPAGTYGASGQQERFLGCVNAQTQSGSWTAWQDVTSGTCTACPATTAETQTQWVSRSETCPAGLSGSVTYEAEQVRTRDVSYSCPAGTPVLPAPSYTAWGTWADTGGRRNTVNTCAAVSGCSTQQNWNSHLVDATDPSLDPAGSEYSCGNIATWHNTCSAGDVCSVVDRPGSGGPGWKEWYDWEMVCTGTCYVPPSSGCQSGQIGSDVLSPANWWCPGYNTSTGDWPLNRPALFGADDIYIATTNDDPKTASDDGGGTFITGWQTMPKASWSSCGMPAADAMPLVGEYWHATTYQRTASTPLPAECGTSAPPVQCAIPAGHVFNWNVGGNACTFTQPAATSVAVSTNFGVTDSTAPTTGAANFACSASGVLATTPNAGATCTTSASCVPPSGALNGVWALTNTLQIDPYGGAPGNVETNIGDLTRRNSVASAVGGTGPWAVTPFMGIGCYNTSNGGSGTSSRPMLPPAGACIVGERVASRVWGPAHGSTGVTYNPGETFVFTCQAAPPPTYNGLCSQITRPLTWGCGEVRLTGGIWTHVPGSVNLDESLNGGWFGNGTVGTRCVFGYADALDAQGYPTPLSPADEAKLVFTYTLPSASDFDEDFHNGSDGSYIGNVGWTRIYARDTAPNPIRGQLCITTKWELMNN